jgi:hypothetical protein
MERSAADRTRRALEGSSEFVERAEILLPDSQSAELGMAARRKNPAAVSTIPLEFIDDTLSFNPEWVVDKIAPRPILFITSDNDRLVKGYGHYEVYEGEAFCEVMAATTDWYARYIPARK